MAAARAEPAVLAERGTPQIFIQNIRRRTNTKKRKNIVGPGAQL